MLALTYTIYGGGGHYGLKIGLFRNRLKYNVKIFNKIISKTMNKFLNQKCRDKRILPKYLDLFDKNI